MITKGLIKTIDYNNNSCTVRLPLFEGANTVHEVILPAIFSIQPGIYNGYAEGDVVFVDFETDNFSTPIVIGKLFLGTGKEENSNKKGNLTASTLTVTNSASLPLTTALTFDTPASTRVPVDNRYAKYKSLLDIINALNKNDDNFSEVERIDYEAITEVKTAYLSQESSTDAPALDDSRWTPIMPAAEDGKNIWQKTTFHNRRGQILKSEIICLANLATMASYWVDYSARTHKGINQQDSITATAWKQFGNNSSEPDSSKYIRYGWRQDDGAFGETNDEYSVPVQGQVTVPVTSFKNADLIFELGSWDGTTFTKTDSEIITYSPIETPVLDLSNDSATLVYKPNGDKIGEATVSSTATVYLDGRELTEGVTYAWSTGATTATLEVSSLTNETEEFTCTATITDPTIFKNPITLTKVFTVSKQIKGADSVVSVIESSMGTSFKAPLGDRTTTLTAYLYEGTELLDSARKWYYEWYWFDTKEATPTKVVIPRTKENSINYDEEKGDSIDSYLIRLQLKDLINKSVYFIAYPEGRVNLDGTILGVARLGTTPLGKN